MKDLIDFFKLFLRPKQIIPSLFSIALIYVFCVLYCVFVYKEEIFLGFKQNIPLLLYESNDYVYKFLLNNFYMKYMLTAIMAVLFSNVIVNIFFECLIQISERQIVGQYSKRIKYLLNNNVDVNSKMVVEQKRLTKKSAENKVQISSSLVPFFSLLLLISFFQEPLFIFFSSSLLFLSLFAVLLCITRDFIPTIALLSVKNKEQYPILKMLKKLFE